MEERSAGAVVYREAPEGRMYLLLLNAGRWDFAKGGVEAGESELETVVREVMEETGLEDLQIASGFRKVIEYYYRRQRKNVHKQVVYHLAETREDGVRISIEHQGFGWFFYDQAIAKASYENSKVILREAESFLRKGA